MERTIEAVPVAVFSEILRFDPRAHPAEGLAMFAKGSRVFPNVLKSVRSSM